MNDSMPNNSLRTTIARALFDGVFLTKSPEWLDQEWEAREWRRSGKDGDYERQADTVLAVLADPPESVIERAARELDPAAYNDLNATSIPRRRAAEAWMRKAFRAAFGINNYKEKRK